MKTSETYSKQNSKNLETTIVISFILRTNKYIWAITAKPKTKRLHIKHSRQKTPNKHCSYKGDEAFSMRWGTLKRNSRKGAKKESSTGHRIKWRRMQRRKDKREKSRTIENLGFCKRFEEAQIMINYCHFLLCNKHGRQYPIWKTANFASLES